MFNFQGAAIVQGPTGRYFLAGAVPAHPRCVKMFKLVRGEKATIAAVMGGRVVTRGGKEYGWTGRTFPNVESAERAVRLAGGKVIR